MNKAFSNNYHAASEVIGAIILVLIAVGAFSVIYLQFFPIHLPSPEPHVQLAGYVTDSGQVVLQHVGGESLVSYDIRIEQSDGPLSIDLKTIPGKWGSVIIYRLTNCCSSKKNR